MGTIAEKLSYLNDTKELFKDRLNSLGAEITSSTTFRNYLNWLDTFYNNVSDKTDLSVNGVVGRTSQNTAILPSEYTQVDYIHSSGTQYIDTGVNADYKLSIKTEFSNLSQSSYQGSMSGNNATNRVRHHLQITSTGNVIYWAGLTDSGCSTTIITGTDYDSSKKYNIFADIYNQKYYLDGTEISGNFNSNDFDTELNYYLFGRNTNNVVSNMVTMKMYSCKIYYNNVIVRDFIPCYRNSDNEVGLYDLVNDVFYTNQGTGAFTYGSVVSIPNPDYPQPINNLSGDVAYNVSGKNLFDKTKDIVNGKTYNSSGGIVNLQNVSVQTEYISVNKNSSYTLSSDSAYSDVENHRLMIVEYDANRNFIKRNLYYYNERYLTITTDVNTSYVRLGFTSVAIDKLQFERNDEPTAFEPYIEPQTFTIPLGDIELCKIDTYEDKIYSSNGRFYLRKNINKVILNGSEFVSRSEISPTYITDRFRVTIDDTKVVYAALSNRFIARTSEAQDREEIYSTANRYLYISINRNRLATDDVAGFKSWLSTHNTIVYYALATPTTTEITQENYPSLYNALKQIQDYLTAYKINKEFILGYSSPEIEY